MGVILSPTVGVMLSSILGVILNHIVGVILSLYSTRVSPCGDELFSTLQPLSLTGVMNPTPILC